MENMTQRIVNAQSAWISAPLFERALVLTCATPATDLWTSDVRSIVRVDVAPTAAKAIEAKRVRATAPTTGMGHVGFVAGYVPGSRSWSPPI